MVNTLLELPTSMSMCPLNSNLVTTSVHAFSNKKKLEVSKGSNHFDLSFEPIGFPYPLNFFRPYKPITTSNFHRKPSSKLHIVT